MISRHYRCVDDDKLSDEPQLNLFYDLLDSFHLYLLHMDDIGLRTYDQKQDKNNSDHDKMADNESYDPEFAQMAIAISSTRDSSERFQRISVPKYKIEIGDVTENEPNENIQTDEEYTVTYLDSLINHLHEQNVNSDTISKLVKYFKEEQYETEAIDLDLL